MAIATISLPRRRAQASPSFPRRLGAAESARPLSSPLVGVTLVESMSASAVCPLAGACVRDNGTRPLLAARATEHSSAPDVEIVALERMPGGAAAIQGAVSRGDRTVRPRRGQHPVRRVDTARPDAMWYTTLDEPPAEGDPADKGFIGEAMGGYRATAAPADIE